MQGPLSWAVSKRLYNSEEDLNGLKTISLYCERVKMGRKGLELERAVREEGRKKRKGERKKVSLKVKVNAAQS